MAYRLLRICSNRETLILRLEELKQLLLTRDYREKSIQDAINKVLNMSRDEALKEQTKKKTDRTVFVVTYNPALPSVSKILKKHWGVMVKDPYLKKVFPSPPMVAYRRPKNLRNFLIKAKIPPNPPQREKRCPPGMKKCNGNLCETCPFVLETRTFQGPFNNKKVDINSPLNCSSSNVVYCLKCDKNNCRQIYIGQTQRTLKERFSEHKTSVRTHTKNSIGEHFNLPGHSVTNMKILALEKVKQQGTQIIEKRESFWINQLEAEFKGLNRKK